MKKELLAQFKDIKDTLSNNVDTIGRLINQAKSLSELAEKLDGTSQTEIETKQKLQEEVDNIQVTIANLIKQTQMLFELYDKFAEELFTSK